MRSDCESRTTLYKRNYRITLSINNLTEKYNYNSLSDHITVKCKMVYVHLQAWFIYIIFNGAAENNYLINNYLTAMQTN